MCFLALAAHSVQAQQYELIDLGTLGGPRSVAKRISESGIVTGWAQLPTGHQRAVIWDQTGNILNLGALPEPVVTEGVAVNDAGQVAGLREEGSPQSYQSYSWENGLWTPIGVLPGLTDTIVADIDSAGRIVGRSLIVGPGDPDRAFIWNAGVLTELESLGYDSRADGINDLGQVAGASSASGPTGYARRAVLWQDGVIQDLGVLPGEDFSQAFDINDRGDVVGSSWHVTSPQFLSAHQATLWRADGRVVDLGLTPAPPQGTCAANFPFWTANIARAVNDVGQVVGQAQCVASGGAKAAFLWDPEDEIHYNLNDLIPPGSGLDLIRADDINAAGQIVGTAVNAEGYLRAFLLQPIATCSSDPNCDDGLFCNGAEICVGGLCQDGDNPCPGQGCNEGTEACLPLTCDNDGACEAGEDCSSCPADCVSGAGGSPACGDGVCQPSSGEDCLSCASDCRGKQTGNLNNRYCCGLDVDCADARCTAETWICDDTPSVPYCCGDAVCDPGEDQCNCQVDCGEAPPIEANCTDGVDNDCDALTDGADPECACGQKADACLIDSDCCSEVCKRNGVCR
jgi:probable HAF family extracellular repeat protein